MVHLLVADVCWVLVALSNMSTSLLSVSCIALVATRRCGFMY